MPINFKREEEVKEYLDNLAVEYRFGCYSEKKPEVCHLLGDYLDSIKNNYHKAGRIYKSNCDDDNYAKSCHSYGNYLINGVGVAKRNEDAAYEYYSKACSLGLAISCFNAGLLAIRPRPNQEREKDYTKGIELLDKSCMLNDGYACYFLSGLYISGSQDNVISKDMEKAFKYSEKGCELGHLYACMNLSLMYKKGEGVAKNEEMTEKINKRVEEIKNQIQKSLEFQRTKDSV